MRCTGCIVIVYGVQLVGVHAQVRLALDVLGTVHGEGDLGSTRVGKKNTAALVERVTYKGQPRRAR